MALDPAALAVDQQVRARLSVVLQYAARLDLAFGGEVAAVCVLPLSILYVLPFVSA